MLKAQRHAFSVRPCLRISAEQGDRNFAFDEKHLHPTTDSILMVRYFHWYLFFHSLEKQNIHSGLLEPSPHTFSLGSPSPHKQH